MKKTIPMKTEIVINAHLPDPDDKHRHIPMCGWHQNYADFTYGKTKGTVTFTGNLNVSIANQFSFVIPVEQIVKFCLAEVTKHKRALGVKKRKAIK